MEGEECREGERRGREVLLMKGMEGREEREEKAGSEGKEEEGRGIKRGKGRLAIPILVCFRRRCQQTTFQDAS